MFSNIFFLNYLIHRSLWACRLKWVQSAWAQRWQLSVSHIGCELISQRREADSVVFGNKPFINISFGSLEDGAIQCVHDLFHTTSSTRNTVEHARYCQLFGTVALNRERESAFIVEQCQHSCWRWVNVPSSEWPSSTSEFSTCHAFLPCWEESD